MKKLVTTGFQGNLLIVPVIVMSLQLLLPSQAAAQQGCVMSCLTDVVPVSISNECSETVTYALLGVTLSEECSGEVIVDIMENEESLGDVITTEMVGNTYMVIVSNPQSGQSCMTSMLVIDGQAPEIDCPDDITLPCTADVSQYTGLLPSDVEDCSSTSITFFDVLTIDGCDFDIMSQYSRTYYVRDIYNNVDSCTQLISLEKVDLDDVEFPADLTMANALFCSPPPDTSPVNTDFPSVGGNPIINGSFCNLLTTKNDLIVPLCSGSYKILRTWTVMDWCVGMAIDSMQVIEVIDNTPPIVSAPADITISANSSECSTDVVIPPSTVSDACSSTWNVRMQGIFGTIQSNGGILNDLSVGVYQVTFVATDACGNEGSDVMVVTVQDLQPPVPVCNQFLAIPLNNVGNALIPASAFDAASTDNCGPVYFKVRRMTQPVEYTCANPGNPNNLFDDHVMFCCEDIANNDIMVVLRVYDLPPVPGPVSTDYLQGHYNDCMIQVTVQDKLPPAITCPPDLTISCIYPFSEENLSVFGKVVTSPADQEEVCLNDPGNPGLQCYGFDGLATDNCNVRISESATVELNMCGGGIIVRTFTATDDGGLQATCEQRITVVNFDPFVEGDIDWPEPYTTSDVCDISLLDPEDLPPGFGFPILTEGPCDLAASSYEDEVYDLSNNDQACFKILRKWSVIDWCQLDDQGGGRWEYMQVIKVANNTGPVFDPIEDINECSFDANCGGLEITLEATAGDDCSGAASLTWKYFIDIDNDLDFDFTSGIINGETISFTYNFPIGSHRVLYTVWDQCGNSSVAEQNVNVESCKTPSAVCLHGLSTNLMAMDLDGDGTADWGMVTLQAEMFDGGSSHACGNEFSLAFSSDPADVSRVFDCEDLGINEVELWVIDENGLTDFCITTVDIQDNNSICPEEIGGSGTISGSINVPNSGKLAGASIYLDGSPLAPVESSNNGYYVFPLMSFGGQYEVRPECNTNAKNGVTTIDLVKIQKHLLGLETFTNPYQYIAADVNNSESITAVDIVQLRKLILGHYDTLPNNTSWRFVDEAYIFPDPFNPWISNWSETYVINPFSSSMHEINFNAVKIGDINLSANLQFANQPITTRSNKTCEISYTVLPEGQEGVYKVELILDNANDYSGVQFAFTYAYVGYEILEWVPGDGLTVDDIRVPENPTEAISLAYTNPQANDASSVKLMTLWVKEKSVAIPFALYLTSRPTEPLAYLQADDEEIKVALRSVTTNNVTTYNKPNPFKDLTSIVFESKYAEAGVLNVFDANGRLVHSRKLQLVKGENETIVRKGQLGEAGLYVYEIKTLHQYTTNKMIIVEQSGGVLMPHQMKIFFAISIF